MPCNNRDLDEDKYRFEHFIYHFQLCEDLFTRIKDMKTDNDLKFSVEVTCFSVLYKRWTHNTGRANQKQIIQRNCLIKIFTKDCF